MNLEVSIITEETSSIIVLKGEIDVYTSPKLKEELLALVGEQKHRVYIDLAGVHYMDSTGLGILIGGLKASKANNGQLIFKNITERLDRLFTITGFSKVIDTTNEEEV
jgi:anti-sigma B factor antagonist